MFHIGSLLLIPLILLGIVVVPAEGYYMDYLGFAWDRSPLICIWDSKYNEHAKVAVLEWYNSLVKTFGDGYVFSSIIVNGEVDPNILKACSINIIYVYKEDASFDSLDGITGTTYGIKGGSALFLFIYEARNPQPTPEDFDNSIIRTTMHEIGHGFGLNHVMPESPGEGLKPWPSTLMWPWQDTNDTYIDEQTLLAFKCLYRNNGWIGNTPYGCLRFNMFF